MKFSRKELKKHLAEEHQISPISTYLQEIVYGGNDGIITTFAVVAGFAGAQGSTHLVGLGYIPVLLFGLANLFADASSMALGNFLGVRSEHDRYRKERAKELHELTHNPTMERLETVEILKERGFTEEKAEELVKIYETNPTYWADFMMHYELQIADPDAENPYHTALATFFSFQIFGIIPLLPYIVNGSHPDVFNHAIGATLVALLILGLLRWKITKQTVLRSVGEVLLMGILSASIAFIVGMLFR